MNYLAHAYLSFNHPEILVGNMVSDFIKGKKQYEYPENIQKGIRLHRAIDTFTDAHIATKEASYYFKDAVGPYSGAFADIIYDHFLANDSNEFTDLSLQAFAGQTYKLLQLSFNVLPVKFQNLLPYMKQQNWLYNYRHRWGMARSFEGLARRAVYLHNSQSAFEAFEKNYEALQKCYNAFFPEVKAFATATFKELTT